MAVDHIRLRRSGEPEKGFFDLWNVEWILDEGLFSKFPVELHLENPTRRLAAGCPFKKGLDIWGSPLPSPPEGGNLWTANVTNTFFLHSQSPGGALPMSRPPMEGSPKPRAMPVVVYYYSVGTCVRKTETRILRAGPDCVKKTGVRTGRGRGKARDLKKKRRHAPPGACLYLPRFVEKRI